MFIKQKGDFYILVIFCWILCEFSAISCNPDLYAFEVTKRIRIWILPNETDIILTCFKKEITFIWRIYTPVLFQKRFSAWPGVHGWAWRGGGLPRGAGARPGAGHGLPAPPGTATPAPGRTSRYSSLCSFFLCSFLIMVVNAGEMLVNDGEIPLNDVEMLVNDGEMSVWSNTHFTFINKHFTIINEHFCSISWK